MQPAMQITSEGGRKWRKDLILKKTLALSLLLLSLLWLIDDLIKTEFVGF